MEMHSAARIDIYQELETSMQNTGMDMHSEWLRTEKMRLNFQQQLEVVGLWLPVCDYLYVITYDHCALENNE
ncbi:hypothetical protein TSUD_02500 [Trifolium subterraneum]|uniref:Uncharacterized protein n=1 Tax=Trifolium subterraneum TaxID=3900 RepID=A0A2Z6M668_TRISU|nr:hypothetical protein TSUD_02500 [Trifolium subterraneum]